jgi:hypothetical protein
LWYLSSLNFKKKTNFYAVVFRLVQDMEYNRKDQKSPWPWIIGMIILAGFIWFALIYIYQPENKSIKVLSGDLTYAGSRYNVPVDTVNEVKEFIDYNMDTSKVLSSKQFSEKGLIKLQSAISYVADRVDSTDESVKVDIDSLDRTVAKIDTSRKNYLSELKPALSISVNAMASIQKINYPDLADDISSLSKTESRIRLNRSVKSQLSKIKLFYTEAGNTLQKMKLSYAFSLNKDSY